MPLAPSLSDDPNSFWQIYRKSYQGSLADAEKGNLSALDEVFFNNLQSSTSNLQLSPAASRAALFIMLYRGYPYYSNHFNY
jgi:tryptophan 2,3-dioxygenase